MAASGPARALVTIPCCLTMELADCWGLLLLLVDDGLSSSAGQAQAQEQEQEEAGARGSAGPGRA